MSKDSGIFTPVLPSAEVQKFLNENPIPNWENSLIYLLDNYPQLENGEVQWLVEGGAAVRLYNPSRRLPNDVDIITRNVDMRNNFVNARRFDIKTAQRWFESRGLEFNRDKEELLFADSETKELQGRPILLLNPVALVISKTISTHRHSPPRPEDRADIDLLRAPESSVQQLMERFTRP